MKNETRRTAQGGRSVVCARVEMSIAADQLRGSPCEQGGLEE
jgi:hypothetical protein